MSDGIVRKPFIILGPNDKLPFFPMRNNQSLSTLADIALASEMQYVNEQSLNETGNTYNQPSYNIISPSSIPNPSPSIMTKSSGVIHDSYGNYVCTTTYPYQITHLQPAVYQNSSSNTAHQSGNDAKHETILIRHNRSNVITHPMAEIKNNIDYEEQFQTKIISNDKNVSEQDVKDMPNYQITTILNSNEKFSLKTSIPISKLDFKTINGELVPMTYSKMAQDRSESAEVVDADGSSKQKSTDLPNTQGPKLVKQTSAMEQKSEYIISDVKQMQSNEPKFTWSVRDITSELNNPNVVQPMPYANQQNQQFFRPNIPEQTDADPAKNCERTEEPAQNYVFMTSSDAASIPTAANNSAKQRLLLTDNIQESKVVALKRLHHDNCDENDFENLITENQIYGNKIVIKEKSHTPKTADQNADGVMQPNIVFMSNNQLQSTAKPIVFEQNKQYIYSQTLPNEKFNSSNNNNSNSNTNENKPNILLQVKIQNDVNFTTQTFKTVNPLTQSLSYVKTNVIEPVKPTNVLQNLLNKPNIKITQSYSNQNYLQQRNNNQIIYQVPIMLDKNDSKVLTKNSELALLLSSPSQPKNKSVNILSDVVLQNDCDKKQLPIILEEDEGDDEELSSLDLAELRLKKKRENRPAKIKIDKKAQATNAAKSSDDNQEFRLSYKQYQMYVGIVGEQYFEDSTSEESESESDEDDATAAKIEEVNRLTSNLTFSVDTSKKKVDFLSEFGLTTLSDKNDKELEILERSINLDSITSAIVSVASPDIAANEDTFSLPLPKITEFDEDESSEKLDFFNELQLGIVSKSFKSEYEVLWKRALKDRIKRNGHSSLLRYLERLSEFQCSVNSKRGKCDMLDSHAKDQLEIMTEIKKSVNQNNDLIKKAIDSVHYAGEDDECTISALAEKNFCEISKLSNMADRSLKMFARHPNMVDQSTTTAKDDPSKSNLEGESVVAVTNLVIPNVPKIISLKSIQDPNVMDTSPATSMDEPRNCAAGVTCEDKATETIRIIYAQPMSNVEGFDMATACRKYDNVYQFKWPGIDNIIAAYQKYKEESKNERALLLHETEMLKQDVMAMQSEATTMSNELRQLLSKQQTSEEQRRAIQASLDKITNCIKQIVYI